MKKITLVGVLAGLCLLVNAQQNIKPLYTGDRLPDINLEKILNYKSTEAALSAFQGGNQKLLILDFWHTSCIPCIKSFPKLDSLQQQYNDQLQIILVTQEDGRIVQATLNNWQKRNNRSLSLPFVVQDSLLHRYIRKQYNPHYAWIAPDNVLLAQTNTSFITQTMIAAYLKNMNEEVRKRGYLKRNTQPQKTDL